MSNRRYRGVKMSKSPKSPNCQNLCKGQRHIFASAQVADEYLSSGYRQYWGAHLFLKLTECHKNTTRPLKWRIQSMLPALNRIRSPCPTIGCNRISNLGIR